MQRCQLKKQRYFPKQRQSRELIKLSQLGLDEPDGITLRGKKSWFQQRVFHDSQFMIQAVKAYPSRDNINWVQQEHYIKFLFCLAGKCTIVLDGFGEYDIDRPQVLLTSCPEDMIKVNQNNGGASQRLVSLCVKRDFFTEEIGIAIDALPEPLRSIFSPIEPHFALQAMPMSADLGLAAQSVFSGYDSPLLHSIYYQSKAIELMCLLISSIEKDTKAHRYSQPERLSQQMIERLMQARDIVDKHYAKTLTLQTLSRSVGLNKTALTKGFHSLFGMSVFERIKQVRMARAYQLLSEGVCSIESIAEAVGYGHASSFSNAFTRFYGCTPKAVRL